MGIEWLLFLILAGSVAFLAWQNRQTPGDMKRIEVLLEKFVNEMEEQNEVLLQSISETEEKWEQKVRELEEKIDRLENAPQPSHDIKGESTVVNEPDNEDQLELQQRYQRIFQLHQNGLTTAEIARAVGSGKGEVELILQLSRMNGTNKKE